MTERKGKQKGGREGGRESEGGGGGELTRICQNECSPAASLIVPAR